MADTPLKKVWAYRLVDGHKVHVPAHYLDIPEFGLALTPMQRAKATEPKPRTTTKRATEPASTTPTTKAEEATR